MAGITLPAVSNGSASKAVENGKKALAGLKNRAEPLKDDLVGLGTIGASTAVATYAHRYWTDKKDDKGENYTGKFLGVDLRLWGAAAPFLYRFWSKKSLPQWSTNVATGFVGSWAADFASDKFNEMNTKKGESGGSAVKYNSDGKTIDADGDPTNTSGFDDVGGLRDKRIQKLERQLAMLKDKESKGRMIGSSGRGGGGGGRGRGQVRMLDVDSDGDLDRVRMSY